MASFAIAICTHNRAAELERALASLRAARPPAVGFEVVVVLNDCRDASAEVVRRAAANLPVRAVAEPRAGLSHARNRAVKAVSADYIVFIDDDVRVDPGFLVAYEAAFRRWPEADVFGGQITPVFDGDAADWLRQALPVVGTAYAQRTVKEDGAPIKSPVLPFGTNYALRMSRQRAHPYDPALGRGPVGWIRNGEETEVLEAALAAGATGRWLADARVEHVVSAERRTVAYLWQYYEGYGRLVGFGGRPIYDLVARAARTYLAYRWARLTAPPEAWAKTLVQAAMARGRWKARRDLSLRPAQPNVPTAISR